MQEVIDKQYDPVIINKLNDMNMYHIYRRSKKLQDVIDKTIESIEKIVPINTDRSRRILRRELMPVLTSPGLKATARGELFNKYIQKLILKHKYVHAEFEKKTKYMPEIADWIIRVGDKTYIGYNQLDLWSGGAQINRGAKYILDDPDFINTAVEFKNELMEQQGINYKVINDKKSLYNKDIYMDSCYICDSENKLEAHHINFQKDFKQTINGLINEKKKHLLKDDKANLVVLCDKCHDKLHNNEFEIKGLTKTTKGVKAILE